MSRLNRKQLRAMIGSTAPCFPPGELAPRSGVFIHLRLRVTLRRLHTFFTAMAYTGPRGR
jgi:hypothetical protein